jgi:hypothetical protein
MPVLSENYARPVPLQGTPAQAVLDKMKTASWELAQRENPTRQK